MNEEVKEKEELEKQNKLFEELTELTLILQKEVKELKEDTCVNAQHISDVKKRHSRNLQTLNNDLSNITGSTQEFTNALQGEMEKTQSSNYNNFLKELLESDFKALQNEMIEDSKREMLADKNNNKTSASGIPNKIFIILSCVNFSLLVWIIIKFKLLGKLLG